MDLKKLQEEFLIAVTNDSFPDDIQESMVPGGKLDKLGCLSAYRNDYTARLTSTLGDNFESLWTILGDKDFFELCEKYINENPSKLYDLGEYGRNLPEFLKGHEIPYFSELANLEIQFRRLFNSAPKEALSPESFSDLGDPSQIIFELTPELFLSCSKYPLYRIWERRGDNSEESFKNIEWEAENFVMYNSTGSVQVKFLSPFQFQVLKNLSDAKNLDEAISSSGEGNEEEVSELFSFLVSNSLILNYN